MSSAVSLLNHTFFWAGLVHEADNQYCAHSLARNWQLPFLNQQKGENDHRKYFIIKSPWKNVADLARGRICNLTTSETHIQLSPRGQPHDWHKMSSLIFPGKKQTKKKNVICYNFAWSLWVKNSRSVLQIIYCPFYCIEALHQRLPLSCHNSCYTWNKNRHISVDLVVK